MNSTSEDKLDQIISLLHEIREGEREDKPCKDAANTLFWIGLFLPFVTPFTCMLYVAAAHRGEIPGCNAANNILVSLLCMGLGWLLILIVLVAGFGF